MLTIPLEKVCYIIAKARAFDAEEEANEPDPAWNPNEDWNAGIPEDTLVDPTYEELTAAVEALNEDERLDLVALTWIGRGDYSGEEWEEARSAAAEVRDKNFPDYLVGMPQLGDLLEEGLATLDRSRGDYGPRRH